MRKIKYCGAVVRITIVGDSAMSKRKVTGKERISSTVPLNWKEVWFTNCPMV
jgi:hypothetical protein